VSTVNTPTEVRSTRMEALARLPVFLALDGKRAVLAGGNPAAAWKAELLSAAGAKVDVFAADPSEELLAAVAEAPHGPVTLYRRAWAETDLAGAAIAVGAIEDNAEGARFAAAARAAGVPVNVVDRPALCDFAFGAIVNRSPLVVGISTDGAAPVFAQAIRARLEALLPRGFARWVEAARDWRLRVQSTGFGLRARRRFWQHFAAFAFERADAVPGDADFGELVGATRREDHKGSVTLVGAGPGDPGLLTLKAVRALQSADVILFDDLVSAEVLEFSRREARKIAVGKKGYGPSCKQDDINELMVTLAKSGKDVVRLKGGDPMIFGRGGEEIAVCRAAGIPVTVIPGISAAQAAASRLGVSLTDRRYARRLQYVTGHSEAGRLPADIDWQGIADPAAMTAVYMPKRTLAELSATAIANGIDPATPAVAVAGVTRPDETVIAGTVADIATRLDAAGSSGPVVVLIGRALENSAVFQEALQSTPAADAVADGEQAPASRVA
jgi:uroporphyrin-III C-methyltransferase / precorrin-2 dehydrogenase / sirohydrochlorin ferrochelatase